MKTGDIILKISGRDAGNIGTITEVLDNNYVVIDGNTRKRKCNIKHLEFLGKNIPVRKDTDRNNILDLIKKAGFQFKEIKKGNKREKKIQEKTNLKKIKSIVEPKAGKK